MQALLSSFTCLLAWWIGRRTFSPLAGWCAGVLAATYWPWVYFDAELQDAAVAIKKGKERRVKPAADDCIASPPPARSIRLQRTSLPKIARSVFSLCPP